MGVESEDLGEVKVGEKNLVILFTSTIDGDPGDVRRVSVGGGWAPLQFLLRDDGKVRSVGKGKYIYTDKINIPAYKKVAYGLFLQLPKPFPDIEEWPRTFDLKGF